MTQGEMFERAWGCTTAQLDNMYYESADERSLSGEDIMALSAHVKK
jgi:hypothetical protein